MTPEMSSVIVRISQDKSQTVNLSGLNSVLDVKLVIAKQIQLDVNDFNLVFSGKFLNPETSLQVPSLSIPLCFHRSSFKLQLSSYEKYHIFKKSA